MKTMRNEIKEKLLRSIDPETVRRSREAYKSGNTKDAVKALDEIIDRYKEKRDDCTQSGSEAT